MTLKGYFALCANRAFFEARDENLKNDRPILLAAKM